MARRRYRARSSYGYSTRSVGRERALQHIEEARQLTTELGGSDQDVKEYFFSLPAHQLLAILDAYQQRHGRAAREYAEQTLPKWRSGYVIMSGMVASRLFSLLPPRMPLAAKYKLTEDLWRHVGPSSKRTLRVGLDADVEDVMAAVHRHIEGVVVNYKMPESLEKRFNWLSAGDVHVKQDLLNHLRQMEKSLVSDGARVQLPIMLDHLRGEEGGHTHRLAHVLKIGKHELELLIDKGATGVRAEEPPVIARASERASRGDGFLGWWLPLLVIGLLLALGRYLMAQ